MVINDNGNFSYDVRFAEIINGKEAYKSTMIYIRSDTNWTAGIYLFFWDSILLEVEI